MRLRYTGITAIASFAPLVAGACSADDRAQEADATTVAPAVAAPRIVTNLEASIEEIVGNETTIPGVILHVEAPNQNLDVSVATGVDDRATATPLVPDAGFRIASNTKTFTAAAVLRLVEQGALALDDPIADHVASATADPLGEDGYRTDLITVRQLLTHTSGIYDYGQDPAYQAAVGSDLTRQWTRLEQVQWAMDHGEPSGEPGEQYAYSDTGYIVLGEIIERASGAPLASAVRSLLDFDRLGLDETYWEALEPTPPGIAGRAHQYFGELDGYSLNPSFDLYGAAGLVSTADDLSAFYRALLRGELFAQPETLSTMLDIPATNAAVQAGMGIFRHDLSRTTCWGHSGMWGTAVLTCPGIDVTVATSIDQAMPGPGYDEDQVLEGVLELVTEG